MISFSYLKPNFKSHLLNYFFVVIFFCVGFFPVSLFAADYYWKTGYTTQGIPSGSYINSSPVAGCYALVADKGWTEASPNKSSDRYNCSSRMAPNAQGYTQFIRYGNGCPEDTVYNSDTLVCDAPAEPEHCTDLTGTTAQVASANLSMCVSGCRATTSGSSITVQLTGGDTAPNTYTYNGEECNTNPLVPWQTKYGDLFNGTDHALPAPTQAEKDEGDMQTCYTADGKYLGQVSASVNCPTYQQACYDNDTGAKTSVIGQGQSCPNNSSSLAAASRDTIKKWVENKILNPDGSITENKTTRTTETGVDGSTHTTTTSTTGGTNADGSPKTETTTTTIAVGGGGGGADEEKSKTSVDLKCKTPPVCVGDAVDCASLELNWLEFCKAQGAEFGGLDQCVEPPTCTGDPWQCTLIIQDWKSSCNLSPDALNSALDAPDTAYDDIRTLVGDNTDSDGSLSNITEEINVEQALGLGSILADNGRSGSCPPNVGLGMSMAAIFKFDSICQMMEALRPLVLFSAAFMCMMMIYRGLVENM
ncbi:virulence factor TspB C-terminal domain-related protein [Neptunomonas antarctica]|uniref:TspB protein n=1 Tax=Neptunomonas antarctica TaxID=619304 RepID=A0A1N7J5P8_9GAMM|nr:virulence factor TspB C-terminal domain-related protein [Neptunomonas antarctica]SIS44652.1 hypothetical protein SAMN05421760_101651 [Neptunomonas antarctica]